jgi:deazaflavin-dependent oxidoreductase (nitroreductase family)
MILDRVRHLNKRIFNPLMLRIAGSSWSPFAIVRHVGRRSGKPYQTPVVAIRIKSGFLVALPYGPDVDWYRNVDAAGRCIIVRHGKPYNVGKPEPIGAKTALSLFPLPLRLVWRILGTHHFVTMKHQENMPAEQTTAKTQS